MELSVLSYHHEIDKYQLTDKSTLINVLELLNQLTVKIVLITDSAGRLIRTITDGDIRRAILKGTNLDCLVSELPIRLPITAIVDSSDTLIREKMFEHNINAVVLVDGVYKPIKLVSTDKVQSITYLSPPHLGSSEMSYMMDAIDDNWVAPSGPNLKKFEYSLARIVGRKYSCAVSSGTAAIHLALRALEVSQSDRVYVSDLTFVASLQPILYQNAVPVLIDSEPLSWNMSPKSLRRALHKDQKLGRLPKAIIVVHIYGQVADMQCIMTIAAEYDVPVIEDAAESLGAQVSYSTDYNKPILSTYSFNGNKIITTSSGGAIATDDETLRNKIEKLATQGRDPAEHYQHSTIAYNYRMSNLLAGIGIGQLEVLQSRVKRRIEIFNRYKANFSEYAGFCFQQDSLNTTGNRWLSVIKFDPKIINVHPYRVLKELRSFGIETRPSWKPMHLQPLCSEFDFIPHDETHVVSSNLFFTGLCLPSGSSMSNDDVDYVIGKTLKAIIGD